MPSEVALQKLDRIVGERPGQMNDGVHAPECFRDKPGESSTPPLPIPALSREGQASGPAGLSRTLTR